MVQENTNNEVMEGIKNAEKVIQSYAYDQELDAAITYLQENDPDNAVLATVKDFDRPMLKALNALYRVDEASAKGDTEELKKIAEFLGSYEEYDNTQELKEESERILREIGGNDEQIQAVTEIISETDNIEHQVEKYEEVQSRVLSMPDEDILQNGQEIEDIINDDDFRQSLRQQVEKAKETVSIEDEDSVVQNEDDLWESKIESTLNEIITARMDDAEFAAKDHQTKKDILREDANSIFHSNLMRMAGASAVDENSDAETNDANAGNAMINLINGKT
ncbi:MAG: hypothetical protein MJ212_02265, partial [Alphaproteobacteria bacterium]|nr:hypothetical protein [Alphaproteobacteria bacterium]